MPTRADEILHDVYRTLGIAPGDYNQIFDSIDDIVTQLADLNRFDTIPVGTTGTITERLCEAGLKSVVKDSYGKLPSQWKWVGDFYIEGTPFNIIISVKSFKAKERLMASGSGNILSPTVGFGLFDDPGEFNEERVRRYPFRAFLAIYVPQALYDQLESNVQNLTNMNGKAFIRSINFLREDIKEALGQGEKIDITKV
jgi:hypothetical protein